MAITILAFVLILGGLVFTHELGHFWLAKRQGIKVEEFGLGFPPRIWGIKKGETTYSLNWIPFGGFVKIFGENGEGEGQTNSFVSKTIGQRAKVIVAGVAMNMVLAFVLLAVGYMIGLPSLVAKEDPTLKQVQIVEIAADSPAQKAGLRIGDILLGVSSGSALRMVKEASDVSGFTAAHKGEELTLKIKRGDLTQEIKVTARSQALANEGALGIAVGNVGRIVLPWYRAIYEAFISAFYLFYLVLAAIIKFLLDLIAGAGDTAQVSGPIGIYSLTSQASKMGLIYLLQFAMLLSVNFAVINILPFPALDGGRLFFLLVEKIKGSPISTSLERKIHLGGFVVLILLMIAVTLRDVYNLL